MGWIATQFRTRQRWGWTLAGVLLSVLAVHILLLRQGWDSGFALPEPDQSRLVQGHIVMQRMAQAVQPAPPSETTTPEAIPKPSTTKASSQNLAASTDALALEDPPVAEPVDNTPIKDTTPAELDPIQPEAQPLQTQHLQAVSTFWRYQVTAESRGRNFFANATMQWRLDQDQYSAHAVVSALLLGQRSQTSEGRITPQGLTPDRFKDVSRRTREITFDWPQQLAKRDEQAIATSLPEGAQDRLSAIVQLTVQLMNAPIQPSLHQEWAIPVVGFSGLEDWTFVYLGQALQDVPAGKFVTWHLQRKPKPDDSRGTTIDLWLAPAQYFVPVRIRYTEANGDFVDQQISDL